MKDYSYIYKDDYSSDDARRELDILFASVKSYRSSKHYRDVLDVCRRFRYLAPFNAMMVEMQRPGSQMVLTARQWERRYKRRILPNARPVVVLTYQPVSYLFDLSDTEPIGEVATPTQKILEDIRKEYDTLQEVKKADLDLLVNNLPVLGIAYTDKFRAGNGYGARIEILQHPQKIKVPINKKTTIEYNAHYLISVNETLSTGAIYTSILHELGHFFCHHLFAAPAYKGWKLRRLTHSEKEFEAESVARVICDRLNIGNPSEKYLAGYLDEYGEIPENISVDRIFRAHNEIWKLLFERQNATNNFLFNQDEAFQKTVKSMTSRRRIQL